MTRQAPRPSPCLLLVLLAAASVPSPARTLHVGTGFPYGNLQPAAAAALPGDTILFHAGVYGGGQYVAGLAGTEQAWISIIAAPGDSVVVRGGGTAWQLSDPAFVWIHGFTFEQQTLNGVNIDDGGDYSTPARRVRITSCTFRDINATGNNDLLKLSGLDDFEIRSCRFENGSPGGSGIDMVGCHRGTIEQGRFEGMGSNAIQAKGGTQYVLIARNLFVDCGQRTLNLGGSTGLQYFRPLDAPFEAADLQVYANCFVRSLAPIAYVGSTRVDVSNNTIVDPRRWVTRILQETVDTARFIACGDNFFTRNIIYLGSLGTETNIGPNTRPESFTYASNLWYNFQDPSWSGPDIPVTDPGAVIGQDPMFVDTAAFDFRLLPSSPAIGRSAGSSAPAIDYIGQAFNDPRSLGAIEGNPPATAVDADARATVPGQSTIAAFPNPFNPDTRISYSISARSHVRLQVFDIRGRPIATLVDEPRDAGTHRLVFHAGWGLPSGVYLCRLISGSSRASTRLLLLR